MLREEPTINVNRTFFWTDSTSVLQYIRTTKRRFKTFVANRWSVIHEGSHVSQWRHVGTKHNPADVASRGLMPIDTEGLKTWQRGPEYLWEEANKWPEQPATVPPLDDDDLEMKPVSLFTTEGTVHYHINVLVRQYSSWYALKKSMAWLICFKDHCKWIYLKRGTFRPGPLTVEDLSAVTTETHQDSAKRFIRRRH